MDLSEFSSSNLSGQVKCASVHVYTHAQIHTHSPRVAKGVAILPCPATCIAVASAPARGQECTGQQETQGCRTSPAQETRQGRASWVAWLVVADSVPQVKGAERPLLLEAQPVRSKVSRWRIAGGTFPGTLHTSSRSEHLRRRCSPGLSLPRCCRWGKGERGTLPHPSPLLPWPWAGRRLPSCDSQGTWSPHRYFRHS